MSKIDEPPFKDSPNPNNAFWSLSWFEWLRDIWIRVNERPALVGTGTENNFPKFNADADLVDSDKAVPSGDVVGTTDTQTLTNKTADYLILENDPVLGTHAVRKSYITGEINRVEGKFLTENEVPDAGTEEGARFGSFKIGLLTEDDYAFFDEYGKLILYGIAGVQIKNPVNDTATTTKIAVFDTDGNLEYRTIQEVSEDLSNDILASKTYVGERFITENLLNEAGTEPPYIIRCSETVAWTFVPDGNDVALYLLKNGAWIDTGFRWVYTDY